MHNEGDARRTNDPSTDAGDEINVNVERIREGLFKISFMVNDF